MKTLNEKFTDEEFKKLKKIKESSGMNWHDFIKQAALAWDKLENVR